MKQIYIYIYLFLTLLFALPGCGPKSQLNPRKPTTITMWHNYGGDMQKTMDLLIDEFNATEGKEQGIIVNVVAISSSSELNDSLSMILKEDPSAPKLPDIFTGYPKNALPFMEKEMILNLDQMFTKEELSVYVDSFLEEGRLTDGGLYVFPIAKSTEVLYLNKTLFDEFIQATGADPALLESFEGISELSLLYHEWSGGKDFFTCDAWFHIAMTGMRQLGSDYFTPDGMPDMDNPAYQHIFETLFPAFCQGGFAIFDGYSSDLSKTGDILCSIGSSAGILFYGDTITYDDGTTRQVDYDILPYPTFQNGSKIALQRGGGFIVSKSTPAKEEAACRFLKWFTEPKQNMSFVSQTGYLPVTKQAFEEELPAHIDSLDNENIHKMLSTVLTMYQEYDFYTAPNLLSFDDFSSAYEEDYREFMGNLHSLSKTGEACSPEDAYRRWIQN